MHLLACKVPLTGVTALGMCPRVAVPCRTLPGDWMSGTVTEGSRPAASLSRRVLWPPQAEWFCLNGSFRKVRHCKSEGPPAADSGHHGGQARTHGPSPTARWGRPWLAEAPVTWRGGETHAHRAQVRTRLRSQPPQVQRGGASLQGAGQGGGLCGARARSDLPLLRGSESCILAVLESGLRC